MKALAGIIYAVVLSAAAVLASVPPIPAKLDETKVEEQAALDELSHFCNAAQFRDGRPLIRIAAHEGGDIHNPWAVRIYIVNGTHFITWEETGYPRLMWAVKSVEEDFDHFDYGYSGHYGQEKPGYCSDGMKCA